MKNYQKPDGSIWAFEPDGSQDELITSEMTPISDAALALLRAPPPAQPRNFTSLEFLDLFTDAEQLAVVSAAMASAQVKLWYDRMLAASFVSLSDHRTSAGLQALVSAGLLTQVRRNAIVATMG